MKKGEGSGRTVDWTRGKTKPVVAGAGLDGKTLAWVGRKEKQRAKMNVNKVILDDDIGACGGVIVKTGSARVFI